MENIKVFEKIIKGLPDGQKARLPEKIRDMCNNRTEHTELLKAIALGVYLDLNDEISLCGYVKVPKEISPDEQYATSIKNWNTDKMIIGIDKTSIEMSIEDFKRKILYA